MFFQRIFKDDKKQSGFTLIELLIVIGIIAILTAVVIITVAPGERLAEARDATRTKHINALESALYVYAIDNDTYPTSITETLTEICNTNLETPNCSGLIDLSTANIPIPVDPQGSDDSNGSGYEVAVQDGRVLLSAPSAETRTITAGIATEEDSPAWACGDDFTDSRDSNTYSTIEINTQCWMAENLAYLPSVVGPATGSTSTSYYYVYGYNGTDVETAKAESNYTTYGVLYNWPAANEACPTGWHLPTDTEQHELSDFLATGTCSTEDGWSCDPAGAKLAGGFSLWTDGTLRNHANFGSSGFNALPGGHRRTDGIFDGVSAGTFFWSSTAPSDAYFRGLGYGFSLVGRNAYIEAFGFSVRCLRD
jgi:uncharacterized protein (TIGR02145 family)/prepilin-type N-terminal cleavage/methylation domain-containing protein